LIKLKRAKVDALYGKKKHFNAADRIEKYHYGLGVPLVILNILTGSVIFYVVTSTPSSWTKYTPLALALVAALLGGLQTFFNFPRRVEGHRRIGNKYLSIMKKCDRIQGYISDNLLTNEEFVSNLETIAKDVDSINQEAEGYPTNANDYKKSQEGVTSGEEDYTDEELEL